MVNENIRTVRFMAVQGAEDLYRCEETGKVYVRQPCDDKHVRWCTSCKWTGGYEADCPMKEGIIIDIVDVCGNFLFRESLIKVDGYCWTVAEKVGPFSYEAIKNLAYDVIEKHKLQSWDEWRAWLCADYKSMYDGYIENWAFAENEHGKPQKLATMSYLGRKVYLTATQYTHKICGKTWTCYEIQDKYTDVLAVCGFKFERKVT